MSRDPSQNPDNAGPCAGTSEAERQERITQLTQRRSKLSPEDASLRADLAVWPERSGEFRRRYHDVVNEAAQRLRGPRGAAVVLFLDEPTGADGTEP